MTNPQIGLAGIAVLLTFIGLGMPIAVALFVVSVGGIFFIRGWDAAFGSIGSMPFDLSASWTLSAVPMFFLMGAFAFNSGMTISVYRVLRMWFWWVPGGLAIATNMAGTAFGVISGSSVAVTAVMAKIAIPEMLQRRYDKALATAVVAASGTIDALIPPSIIIIIYGIETEASISALFLAGIIPGLLTALIYSIMIVVRCKINPELAPVGERDFTVAERREATRDSWPLPVLFAGVFIGIYSGVMTPTEAGAASAALAFLIAMVRRQMTLLVLWRSLVESASASASIFFIFIGAALFARFMSMSGVPSFLGNVVAEYSPSPLGFVLIISAVIILLGMFLEGIGILLIVVPIIVPICKQLNIDLVWIGMLVIKLIMIGLLHPPIGLQAFVVKSVVGDTVPLMTIFRGLLWFLAAEVVIVALMIAFPSITLWLPHQFGYH
ncbi:MULTISPECIES: TRAP transporter large permease [unclassified Beijerinckia]|uniref:TRAP transporter large permease n=1 Tax=unclassified Beijerinckia TaxID=2638183 RepID=UPI000B87C3D6|nr:MULTISPECIES: TRAP transporter large permease [unclassified Beijerinckia]